MTKCLETDDARRRKRLRFRAWHRGIREADLILGPFADEQIDRLEAAELDDFEALLAVADTDLHDWFIGRSQPPPHFNGNLIARIRAHLARPTS
jgi:antitoxin CptB